MAYFAKIDETNKVVEVVVISNDVCGEPTLTFPDTDSAGRAFIANTLKFDGTWKQTSFNGSFRGRFAGVGYEYSSDSDVFIAPQPFPSWTLDSSSDWQAPTAKPNDGKIYRWEESSLAWVVVVG